MKRIRREADRARRQMRDDMCEPATRPCDLILWPTLRDVFPSCDECKPGMRERVCGLDFMTAYLADLNNADAADERCECTTGVQACVSTPLMGRLSDVVPNDVDDLPNCEECNPETCTFECGTGVQALSASDADWILDKHEPYEIDDEFPS